MMTATMRAIQVDHYGSPDQLHLTQHNRPAPAPTEVLVRVHAAGVNPVDWKTRAGAGVAGLLGNQPFIPGWDVSGVVEEVGAGTTEFQVGDEVYGMPRFPQQAGAYADYLTAPSGHLALKPISLDHVHAAALPLAGLTAWQALHHTAKLTSGQRVLIHAAAGGVGHLAVQIAQAAGAYVIGTASAGKHDFIRDLGADEVIDYHTVDFATAVHDVDVVVDLIGGEYSNRSLSTLRKDGLLIVIPSGPDAQLTEAAKRAGVHLTGMLVAPDQEALVQLAALVDEGEIRVVVDTVLPLAQAAQAHRLGEAGRTQGKIVLSATE